MSTKQFTLGAVLSITANRCICEIDEVQSLLSHMVGESLMTHQLPRALDACRPVLLEQHPALTDVQPGDLKGEDALMVWLEVQSWFYGTTLDVAAGVPEWQHIDPIAELEQKMGPGRFHVVVVPA